MMVTDLGTNLVNRTANSDRGGGRSSKRKYTYDASVEEQFPDDPWYALNHEDIIAMVDRMLDNLICSIEKYAISNPGIQELVLEAKKAKQTPNIKQFCLAVLGEQGVGKSSLINALFGRCLLHQSPSSKACTASATMIVYKEGASDHTRISDVKIEFLSDEEVERCINEQVHHWTEMYPGPVAKEQHETEEQDSDDDLRTETMPTTHVSAFARSHKTLAEQKRQAASTAKEFFQIVFNTKVDHLCNEWLEQVLHTTDISKGDFTFLCCQKAQERLVQIGTELGIRNRIAEFLDISDNALFTKQAIARKLWPFVKLVTIATGHVLLRHGLCLFDLPGYGDMSHLRRAIINEFRWRAHFEMVVVPSLRVSTNVIHHDYLDLSLHLKGATKTMVVMNKVDELIDWDDILSQCKQIADEPFPALAARLEHIGGLEEEDEEDPEDIADMLYQVEKDIAMAYIKHETDHFRRQLEEKGVMEFHAVAAKEYMAWMNPPWRRSPKLGPNESGIPALRRFLFSLPAEQNLLDYKAHVFERLPAFRTKAGCFAKKHVEDASYAEMRQGLRVHIPVLDAAVQNLQLAQVNALVANLWYSSDQENVTKGVTQLVKKDWIHAKIHYQSFAKMLRENGIPVSGKHEGRNLNDDILGTMKQYLTQWQNKMLSRIEQLAQGLNRPVQDLIKNIESSIRSSSAVTALKQRATEALMDASRRVEAAYSKLLIDLEDSLRVNHLRHTTEIDVYCPVAREMAPVYQRALNVKSGQGVYKRHRKSIVASIAAENTQSYDKPIRPLAENVEEKLVRCQKDLWVQSCDMFTDEAISQLLDFSDTTDQLVKDDIYMTEENKKARAHLRTSLMDFDRSLQEIQDCFTSAARERPEKKRKSGKSEEGSALCTMPPAFDSQTP